MKNLRDAFRDMTPDEMREASREAEIAEWRASNRFCGRCGASETLYACNTYQFADYSRYDMTLFTEEEKRAYRDAQFPIDLANARALGRRLVEKALANALQAK